MRTFIFGLVVGLSITAATAQNVPYADQNTFAVNTFPQVAQQMEFLYKIQYQVAMKINEYQARQARLEVRITALENLVGRDPEIAGRNIKRLQEKLEKF